MAGGDTSDSPLEAAAGAAGPQVVEAFELLASETRLAIMLALWEARTPWERDDAVAFSTLYEQVEVSDSGQFNYHLDKLTPEFVQRTDDGYELTDAGFSIVQAVISGSGFSNPTVGPVEIDRACPRCATWMTMEYEGSKIRYFCPNCEGVWSRNDDEQGYVGGGFRFPPAGLEDRTPTEVAAAFNAHAVIRGLAMHFGVCPDCSGRIESTIEVCDDHDVDDGVCANCGGVNRGSFMCECTVCKLAFGTAIWVLVAIHPTVAGFFYEDDFEYFAHPWKIIRNGYGASVEPLSTDPDRLAVTFTNDDDELRVVIDEDLHVVELAERD